MSEKLPCIIVDIDGTIADCSHRLHHATHLRTKDRVAMAKLAPANTKVRYIIFNNRSIEETKRTAGWRNEVPGLIDKHFQRLKSQLPEIRRGDGLPNVIVEELI